MTTGPSGPVLLYEQLEILYRDFKKQASAGTATDATKAPNTTGVVSNAPLATFASNVTRKIANVAVKTRTQLPANNLINSVRKLPIYHPT